MMRRSSPWIPPLALPIFLAAAVPCAAILLDPQPDFEEFRPAAAIRSSGEALLTWTRQQEPGGPWTAMAAAFDPNSGQLGEIHEWGDGGSEQVVPLGSGYLAIRVDVTGNPPWVVQHLDDSGQPLGEGIALGFIREAVASATPDGGAIVVAAGVNDTGGTAEAWRFGPGGALLPGPTTLVDNSLEAAVGVDADGNVVLAWTDQGTRLFARRFSSDLQPLGPVLDVALGGAHGVCVAVAPDGRFVVVFAHFFQLYARAYRADGSAVGKRRPFSSASELVTEEDFDVAINEDGRILAVWKGYENSNLPVIRARALSLAGRATTKVFRLARINRGRGDLLSPRVESLPEKDFLVLWSRVEADGVTVTMESRRFAGR